MLKKVSLPIRLMYIILIWIGIALFYGGQQYIQHALDGEDCDFFRTVIEHVPTFFAWALAAPIIQYQIQKNPIINSPKIIRDILAHFLLATAISLFILVVIGFGRWLYYRPYTDMPWLEYLRRFMLLWFLYQYFLYGSMLIFLLALNFYVKFKDKETQSIQLQKDLIQSQLTLLKSQLHPHFLFNTLNSVSMLIRLDKKEKANNVIALFGDLLRAVIQKNEEQFTSIDKEIEFIEKYLKIESIRFQDNFSYAIHISPEVRGIHIPDMLLQPVVENCIKHGFRDAAKEFKIDISARREEDTLKVIITDNGIGFDISDETLYQKGVGIRNIRERCAKLYSPGCIELESKKGEGTKVSIAIPLNTNE